jgi:hypothetical protein
LVACWAALLAETEADERADCWVVSWDVVMAALSAKPKAE